jgi:hypothetical protein
LKIPYANILLDCDASYSLRNALIADDIVIFDGGNSLSELKKGISAIAEAFPKRIFLLSLSHDSTDYHI